MKEAQWVNSQVPKDLYDYLRYPKNGLPSHLKPTDRQWRLFTCAAFRLLPRIGGDDLDVLRRCEESADGKCELPDHMYWCAVEEVKEAAGHAVVMHRYDNGKAPQLIADILRDIIGNPFKPLWTAGKTACPDCPEGKPDEYCDDCGGDGWVRAPCSWRTPQVSLLAKVAYLDRHPNGHLRNDCLASLTDAMFDAGFDDGEEEIKTLQAEMVLCVKENPSRLACDECHKYQRRVKEAEARGRLLQHLRHPGPHYRGCHALDLLLERD